MPPYDIVMPVGPDSTGVARIAATSLFRFLQPDRFFIVGAPPVLQAARSWNFPRLILIDENGVVPGITLQRLRDMQTAAGRDSGRAGWYLQQFLKMGMARHPEIGEHYLAWDADTVLLRPLSLFEPDGRTLITSGGIPMLDYYRTLGEALLGEPVPPGVSCIREQMMFRTTWMGELLDQIEATGTKGESWAIRIMSESLALSYPGQWAHYQRSGLFRNYEGIWDFGFSEYETYAIFLRLHHADEIEFRELRSERHGAMRYGLRPNPFDLEYLARRFDYVSFERWSPMKRSRIWKNKWRAFRYAILRGGGRT